VTTYRVEFNVEIPDDVDENDVVKFMEFELGAVGSLSAGNALSNKDLGSLEVTNLYVWLY